MGGRESRSRRLSNGGPSNSMGERHENEAMRERPNRRKHSTGWARLVLLYPARLHSFYRGLGGLRNKIIFLTRHMLPIHQLCSPRSLTISSLWVCNIPGQGIEYLSIYVYTCINGRALKFYGRISIPTKKVLIGRPCMKSKHSVYDIPSRTDYHLCMGSAIYNNLF